MTRKAAAGADASQEKDPMIGKQLGDYRLTSVLATGGMARIYKGMDYKLQRQAAVKVLAHEDAESDKTLTKRFQREARAVAALEHDNIITIYQYGEQDGVYYLAMKLVKGKDLAQELKRLKKAGQKMDVQRSLRIMEQVAAALDAAHKADVVHRDVKPSNILLDENDKAILTDFGLVLRSSVETTLGTAFGTPRYIAPEQAISSNKALPQSDIYSLAVILYEILTGETPFSGESPMEIALSHISDPVPPPRSRNPAIPEGVERELLKALEKEPEKRHRSATEFIQTVKRCYEPNHVTRIEPPKSSADSLAESWSLPTAPPSAPGKEASTARSLPEKSTTDVPTRSARSRLPLTLLALLLVVAGGAALLVLSGGNTSGALALGAPVTLIYDATHFAIHNGGSYTLDVNELRFVRGVDGQGGDDFNAYRIRGKILPPGSCARVLLQGDQEAPPPQCGGIQSAEFLVDQQLFFWRKETKDGTPASTFEVWHKDVMIQRCDTVARGGDAECRFTWPVPPPTPEGTEEAGG